MGPTGETARTRAPAVAPDLAPTLPPHASAPPATQVAAYLAHAFGPAQLQRLSAALCRPSLQTCLRVNDLRTTPQVGRAGICTPVAAPVRTQTNVCVRGVCPLAASP
jgi:hypothetical protein